jgi:hypothetical protein
MAEELSLNVSGIKVVLDFGDFTGSFYLKN